MKKIRMSIEQFYEWQRLQAIRDISGQVCAELAVLEAYCNNKDKQSLCKSATIVNIIKKEAIDKIRKMITYDYDD